MEKNAVEPVKYFIAALISADVSRDDVVKTVEHTFGTVDWTSPSVLFDHTDYYEEEMGKDLKRFFLSLHEVHPPSYLVTLKLRTDRLEKERAREGRRNVNLDPGYLDYTKVVLASGKPGGWKIYLDSGVYADMTLYYEKGSFLRFGWTFPDFRAGAYDRYLLKIRSLYKNQAKNRR